ncbi:MAG: hypothetical protein GTO60_16020, partial [Gammaproteobacteria bacterium]|nr:hypothetical protein [Gammaproteobacteria bacterium]
MKTFKIKAMVLVLFIFAGLSTLFAGDVTFFGPKQYTRNKGKPVTETDTFICPPNYTGSGFTLRLINGDSQGKNRVSSAVITVNGVQVMGPSDFNQQVGTLERTVSLSTSNEISVKLNSKPGAYVIIDIHKFIPEPEVSFIATPDTIQYQQSSTLSWNVLNADTITIDNGIGSVGPTGSVQVSPEVPTTTYTLTAVNLGGTTTKLVTVTVIFPVPTVTFSASPLIIRPGVSSTLTWTTFAAHTVTITPGIGNVNLNGSLVVSPVETTTYTITAVGYGGTQTAAALVTVDGIPPQINVTQPMEGAYVNSQNILLKGQVVDTSPVTLKVNGKDTTLQPDNSFEVPLQLAEGPNTIALAAEDAAGNPSTLTLHVVADTIAPQLEITAPKNNDFLNTPVITVTGTLTDANPDKVILNNSIQGVIDGSTFTINNVQLNEGSNTLSVEAFDKASNRTQVSVSCTLDTALPVITITEPVNDSYFNTSTVWVRGTVQDSSPLTVKVNGNDIPLQGNNFETQVTLTEGPQPINVEAIDAAGNQSQASVSCTLDTALPVITITEPV